MMLRTAVTSVVYFLIIICAVSFALAEPPANPFEIQTPVEAQPGPNLDANAATNAYLAEIPASAKAHSDAYFEGG